jgi:hypothetical protein
MADYYAIIFDLTTSVYEKATLELSSTGAGTATFVVYTGGGSSTTGTANFNSSYYVSSESSSITNLFTPSSGASALVKASASVAEGGFLRQWSGSHDTGYYVPPSTQSLGTSFRLPASKGTTTSKLLIGNPSTRTITANVYYGSSSTASVSQAIVAHNFAEITLSQTEKAVRVSTTGSAFVQLAVDLGGEYDISFVLPV